ncbi:MAG: hypothetical protein HC848_08415 [Limnobacter sp.]|nr:hypothetical protein [Limnobacter sp.]
MAELSVAAPQVVAHRVARMATAGPVLSARDKKEFTGMVQEKQLAFSQSWFAMCMEIMAMQQRFYLSMLGGRAPALSTLWGASVFAKGLAPIHRKAVSNSKRLGGF